MRTSKTCCFLPFGVVVERRARGKQLNKLMTGFAGVPLGERWYVEARGEMEGYLRAVFWLARVEPCGEGWGIVFVMEGRGVDMTVPKCENETGVRGLGVMVRCGAGKVGVMRGCGWGRCLVDGWEMGTSWE